MRNGTLLAIIGLLPAAACAGGPGAAPAPNAGTGPTTSFSYRVPSPPTALYHVDDSVVVSVSTAAGDIEVTTTTLLTMNMVFARDVAGVGIVGTVVGFNVVSSSPGMGARSADADDVNGPLALVLGRQGHVEIGAMPSLDSAVMDLTPFPAVAFEIFPRLPARPIGRGGTWVDTVTWAVEEETAESATQTVYTYTLVGDTLVEGETLLNIAMQGDITMEMLEGVGDAVVRQTLTGSTTGYVLWDPERNLPKYAASQRTIEGTNQVPGAGTIQMSISGPVRIWAVY